MCWQSLRCCCLESCTVLATTACCRCMILRYSTTPHDTATIRTPTHQDSRRRRHRRLQSYTTVKCRPRPASRLSYRGLHLKSLVIPRKSLLSTINVTLNLPTLPSPTQTLPLPPLPPPSAASPQGTEDGRDSIASVYSLSSHQPQENCLVLGKKTEFALKVKM